VDFAALLSEHTEQPRNGSPWRSAAVLERVGLNPLHVEQVLEKMQQLHGANRRLPNSLTEELELAREALLRLWRPRSVPRNQTGAPLHIFIGPPGAGKSTVLCKWLAQTVLLDGQAARVWRLDGRTANTSETVSIYGEILGVRVERNWVGRGDATQTGFIDLPGVDFQDAGALEALGKTLAQFPGAQVHLVLNAAYTTTLLLAQARAFSGLAVTDLVMTHLDEETAWGKLWNLVLGTNCPLGFLSAGQNIPGRFSAAQAESLCGPLFGEK
jgi:flagellar biosynthesis protein FlhF